jgi:hypothetical protein
MKAGRSRGLRLVGRAVTLGACLLQIRAAGAEEAAGRSEATVIAAGDIANCRDLSGAKATARLVEQLQGAVVTLGDNVSPDGTDQQFRECYDPTWGGFKDRTRPSAGNHDYHTPGAAAYFRYFGAAAGEPGKGYYSYDLADWHIVALNSNCAEVGGCGAGSPQEAWLRADLAAHPSACTLAYWHHPLFSSGSNPSHAQHPEMKRVWQDLYGAGATIVLNGHEHNYERFAPQDPDGRVDPAFGIRQIVVGVGGKGFDPLTHPQPNSEVRNDGTFGVLRLTLRPHDYEWAFVAAGEHAFADSGTGACHVAPTPQDTRSQPGRP